MVIFFLTYSELPKVNSASLKKLVIGINYGLKEVLASFQNNRKTLDDLCVFTFNKIRGDHLDTNPLFKSLVICFPLQNKDDVPIFKKEFHKYYSANLIDAAGKSLFNVQNYRINEIINYNLGKFYNGDNANMKKEVQNLYTLLNNEGIILNHILGLGPRTSAYSSRFDQIIDCKGIDGKEAKKSAPMAIQNNLPDFQCCTGYNIEWRQRGEVDIYCTFTRDVAQCKIENTIFRATIFKFCVINAIKELKKNERN